MENQTVQFSSIQRLFAVLCIIKLVNSQGTCPPVDWAKYKDEKCFKLVESFSTFAEAKAACISKGGTLAIVNEEEQQKFLVDYIFLQGAAEAGVWIGATRKSNSDFEWEDGTPITYSAWGDHSPSNIEGRDCVAMQPRSNKLSTLTKNDIDGTWKDMHCIIPLYFVCERDPIWTGDQMRKILIENRKNIEKTKQHLEETRGALDETKHDLEETRGALFETKENLEETRGALKDTKQDLVETRGALEETTLNLTETQSNLNQTKSSLETVVKNPVPIGFIYTQLPSQLRPSAIWPLVRWTEVTSQYAGKFFRAAGGNAAAFGQTQQGDSPRLEQIGIVRGGMEIGEGELTINPGSWTIPRFTGDTTGVLRQRLGMKFFVTNPEVRPVNTAVRIWKRLS